MVDTQEQISLDTLMIDDMIHCIMMLFCRGINTSKSNDMYNCLAMVQWYTSIGMIKHKTYSTSPKIN